MNTSLGRTVYDESELFLTGREATQAQGQHRGRFREAMERRDMAEYWRLLGMTAADMVREYVRR